VYIYSGVFYDFRLTPGLYILASRPREGGGRMKKCTEIREIHLTGGKKIEGRIIFEKRGQEDKK